MDGRPSRGRGGSWKRGGGRGGNDSDSFGGEHRGRGRGGHHRGRGKRDHYRGRGRGGGARAAEFHHRDQDDGDDFHEEDDRREVFSRRKLESNWDRYEESEKERPDDDNDLPTQRGADYHVLLESAGDSFTQFRFSEEKDWEMESSAASQLSAAFVDLPALAQILQQVPLHERLNLEAELVEISVPVDLPAATLAPKQETPKTFAPPSPAGKAAGAGGKAPAPVSGSQVSSSPAESPPADDVDEELDELLSLQKPVQSLAGSQTVRAADEDGAIPETASEEAKEVTEEKMEEATDKDLAPPTSVSVRKEVTEEDLEDWLDSMIS